MKITPNGRRIQIEPEEADTILQSEDISLVQKGKVISVGNEVLSCKKGDTIIFNSWGVDKIKINDDDYYFILDTDDFILGKFHVSKE